MFTISRSEVRFLDFIRAIAILLVLIYHFNVYLTIIPFWNDFVRSSGESGVTIFFMLSGFLVSSSFIKDGFVLRSFFIKRFFRVYPLFFISVFLNYLIVRASDNSMIARTDIDLLDIVLYFSFATNSYDFLNPVIWSLRLEVFFYLFIPICCWHLSNLPKKSWLFIYAFAFLVCILTAFYRYQYFGASGKVPYELFLNNFCPFLLGVLLYFIPNKSGESKKMPVVFGISVALFVVLCVIRSICFDQLYYVYRLFLDIVIFLILFTGLRTKRLWMVDSLLSRFLIYTSKISFSLYLFHFNIYYFIILPFIKKVWGDPFGDNGLMLAWYILSFLLSFLVSSITYRIIENPSIKVGKRLASN